MTEAVQTTTATTSEPTTEEKTFRIYPSSAAFMTGPLVETKKPSGCLRYQWAQANVGLSKEELKKSSTMSAETAALGALDEFRYEKKLRRRKAKYEREVPFQVPYKNCVVSGRMDFTEDLKGLRVVHEKKSSVSDYMIKDHFEKNEPPADYVAQLVSYLAFDSTFSEGRLVVSYYQLSNDMDAYVATDERTWTVKVLDKTVISLDGVEYSKSVKDLARWYAAVQQAVSNPCAIPNAPIKHPIAYKNPCHLCPLKALCEKPVEGAIVAQWLQEAKQAFLTPGTPREFKIKTIKKQGVSEE